MCPPSFMAVSTSLSTTYSEGGSGSGSVNLTRRWGRVVRGTGRGTTGGSSSDADGMGVGARGLGVGFE
jgi:hypothetical protein